MKRAAAAVVLSLVGVCLTPCPAPAATTSPTPNPTVVLPYDFDADGFADLAVGAPHLAVGQTTDAGGVFVYPSSAAGPTDHPLVLTRTSDASLGPARTGDGFGTAVASADLDHDGYADLAVGQPGRDLPQGTDAGTVTIFYGSASGLDPHRVTELPVPTGHRADARFGTALVVGDFDGDGRADLAVGAPGDDVQRNRGHAFAASGSVRVYYGGKHGLVTRDYDKKHGKRGRGSSGFDVGFGAVLAVGDLSLDGISDLVVGAPGRTFTGKDGYAGWIDVCRGGRDGIRTCRRPSMPKAYAGNWAGMTSLAVGALWRNTPDIETPQIVIGSPQYADDQPGIVWIVTLNRSTRAVTDFFSFRQGHPAQIPGSDEPGSVHHRFGQSVAVATSRNTSLPFLAIGAPGTDGARGSVTTVLLESDAQGQFRYLTYTQQTPGVPGGDAPGNELGAAVAFRGQDDGGDLELDVAAPGSDDGRGSVVRLGLDRALRLDGAEILKPGSSTDGSTVGARYSEALSAG